MMKIWDCKIGEVDEGDVPRGGDGPMRKAVQDAYFELTGKKALFCFSGWGAELTAYQRAAYENREPHHYLRHIELHQALDELFADFIRHHPERTRFLDMSFRELMEWSYQQTLNPTEIG
jgi:hypothetical protein